MKFITRYIDIEELKPHEKNPRSIKKEAFEKLCKSLENKDYFEMRPIICDGNMVIWAGNQRYRAAKHIGMKMVPTIVADLPEDQMKEIMIKDNLLQGKWDEDLLSSMFTETQLEQFGMDLSQFGVWDEKPSPKDDVIPEVTGPVQSKLGDIYQLGKHRVMCGSSTSAEDIAKLIGKEKARLIFTSPPYNMGADLYNSYEDSLKSEEYINFNLDVIKKYREFLHGFLFWNISYNKNTRSEFIDILYRITKETNLSFLELIIWNKKHAMPIQSKDMMTRQYEDILAVGDDEAIREDLEVFALAKNDRKAYFSRRGQKSLSNYWEVGTNKTQLDTHKACFPVALPMKAIQIMTKQDDIVVDPFLGSGSTLIACEKGQRICYGMELDPHYVDIIVKRYEDFTGEKAIKIA